MAPLLHPDVHGESPSIARRHAVSRNAGMPAEPENLTHSLAEAQPGESLEILEILFEESRRRCAEAGLEVGTRARCRTRTEERVELVLNDGRWAEVASELAPFIEVHVLEPGGPVDLPRNTNLDGHHL